MAMQLYLVFYATLVSLEMEGIFAQLCLASSIPGIVIADFLYPIHGVCAYRPSVFVFPAMLLMNTGVWTAISALVLLSTRAVWRKLPFRRNI